MILFMLKKKLQEHVEKYMSGNLRSISLDVTNRCNMNCSHCYAKTFFKTTPISLEALRNGLNELYDMGVFHYILQGGEPIEDMDRLESIISMIHPEETYITVVSNGWNMTKDTIKRLKELQVDKIAFSLDSGIEDEHDKNRRSGSYKRVLAAVEEVMREGLFTSISTVVTHESLYSEGFSEVYNIARGKSIRLDVQVAMPVGKWDGKKEILINKQDAEYIKKLQLTSPVLSDGKSMIKRDLYVGKKDYCHAGTEFLAISSDGNLMPCNFLQFSLGKINEKSIRKMRDDLLTSRWFSEEYPVCLCGEDIHFIDTYITPYVNERKPLDAYKCFNLQGGIK